MNDHDVTAASQLQAGFKLLIQGKYPDEISVTECSEPLAEVVSSFNRLARQLKELYEYTIPLTRGVLKG